MDVCVTACLALCCFCSLSVCVFFHSLPAAVHAFTIYFRILLSVHQTTSMNSDTTASIDTMTVCFRSISSILNYHRMHCWYFVLCLFKCMHDGGTCVWMSACVYMWVQVGLCTEVTCAFVSFIHNIREHFFHPFFFVYLVVAEHFSLAKQYHFSGFLPIFRSIPSDYAHD